MILLSSLKIFSDNNKIFTELTTWLLFFKNDIKKIIINNITEMSNSNNLIDAITNFSADVALTKDDKNFLKDNLASLKEHINKKESKIISPIIEILEKGRLIKADKNIIEETKETMIELVNKYEEEFNDEDNEDDIDEEKTVDEIESELDNKINKYNGFSSHNPMTGVIFNNKKSLWRLQLNNIESTSRDKNIIIEKSKNILLPKKANSVGKIRDKKFFNYDNHYFLTYWHNNEPLFDIQHIISILNLKKSSNFAKYTEFYKQITNYTWHKNEFDGYILRELISETTMFEILLSSNSKTSKLFKKDVAKILTDLRKEGNLEITNTKILKKHANIHIQHDTQIKNLIEKPHILSYTDVTDMTQLYIQVNQIAYISLASFLNQSVLYAFVVSLKTNHNHVIVKFGWTLDILSRIESLHTEYGSNFYLIGIKKIKNELVEKNFHSVLKQKYPDSIEKVNIKGKEKIELYKFNLLMMNEFNAIEEDYSQIMQNIILTSEQQILINLVKNQNSVFQALVMSQLNFNNIALKTTDPNVINNCSSLHYGFLSMQSTNLHIENMKKLDNDVKIKKIDLEFKKVELELKKADIELKKMELDSKKYNKK